MLNDAVKRKIEVEKIDRHERFLTATQQFRWPAPEGYKQVRPRRGQ